LAPAFFAAEFGDFLAVAFLAWIFFLAME
jgi:hypothetical protein